MLKNSKTLSKKTQEYVTILGINVLSTTKSELLTRISKKIADSSRFSVLTPNPELVLASTTNQKLQSALNSADFPVPDGIGLKFVSHFLYKKPLNIIHGRILFDSLIKLASKNNWKVFLLGGTDNEAEIASRKLQITNSKLQIKYAKGPKLNNNGEPMLNVGQTIHKDAVNKINRFGPDLLFVAFGNPKQEIWIANNLPKLKVRGAMAVGGTFRYVAGLAPLPPKWMEKGSLEWLWRLITEPFRIKRIWNAVVVFPLKVFQYKISTVVGR